MGVWAHVDIAITCTELHGVALQDSTWYRLGFRVYKQHIAALLVNPSAPALGPTSLPADLPECLVPLIAVAADDDAYVTRPFFVKSRHHRVTVNEVARFRAELPAIPSVLASSALYVEATLVSFPVTENGAIVSKETGGNNGLPTVVDAKAFRVGNLAQAAREYYPCNFDGEHLNAVAHLTVRTAVTKLGIAAPLSLPLSTEPCQHYLEWRHMLKKSGNKLVKKWFMQSNKHEEAFYDSPKPATGGRRWLLHHSSATDFREPNVTAKKAELAINTFIAQVVAGDHGCGAAFGLEWEPEAPLAESADAKSGDPAPYDDATFSMGARMLIYIYAKILADTAVALDRALPVRHPEGALEAASSSANAANPDNSATNENSFANTNAHIERNCAHNTTILGYPGSDGAVVSFTDGEVKQEDGALRNTHETPNAAGALFQPRSASTLHVAICQRLNRIADLLGIRKCGEKKLSITVRHGVTVVLDDVEGYSVPQAATGTALAHTMSKMFFGLCTWICLTWDRVVADVQCDAQDRRRYVDAYVKEQLRVFKRMGDPALDQTALVALLRSMRITDEHHFFIADNFPFMRHTPVPPRNAEAAAEPANHAGVHLVVLVHGYNGYPVTMRFVRNTLLAFTSNTEVIVSRFLYENPESSIEHKASLLAQEIDIHVRRNALTRKLGRLSFVTHSMGGLVVRAALRHLGPYREKVHALVTLACPHIGVPRMPSKLLEKGCCLLASYMRSACLNQLLLTDGPSRDTCYLYELSGDDGVRLFRKVKLVGILQDHVSLAYSCLLEPSLANTRSATVESMCHRISERLSGAQLDKFCIDYGRASRYVRWKSIDAHLHIIDYAPLARHFNIPVEGQKLFIDGRALENAEQTMQEACVKHGDVVYVGYAPAVPLTPGLMRSRQMSQIDNDRASTIMQTLKPGSLELEAIRDMSPDVHDAVLTKDLEQVVAALKKHHRLEIDKQRDRQAKLFRAYLNPLTPESQQVIHEEISRNRIDENLAHAHRYLPESFARVFMLFVSTQINQVTVKALVDTGAQETVMSLECAQRCNLLSLVDRRYHGVAVGVSQSRIVGKIHLANLKIGETHIPFSCVLIESLHMDFILGLDLLRRHQCTINLASNSMQICGVTVPFLPEYEIDQRPFAAPAADVPREVGTAINSSSSGVASSGGGSTSLTSTVPASSDRVISREDATR
ncbi:hypothetical protein, conserved [Babesia bigemina]|uniref:Uncharacterized protein n=1 Tax=Babesia bigemina TaxID=5866 RepID=A0A061CZ36_BABBI|nr:hypothetical protein, conserved [Babesia bigemina]CDR93886.1 hypothetical protein, conserved [Babesia bigemina]|eukprot:XP_012766072.1 hypothetical protein, conserved [Babesia bigemina]